MEIDYKLKYLKYKSKYLELKAQIGSGNYKCFECAKCAKYQGEKPNETNSDPKCTREGCKHPYSDHSEYFTNKLGAVSRSSAKSNNYDEKWKKMLTINK
jgi:hypothetical protein